MIPSAIASGHFRVSGLFDSVAGLPVHPLVVHVVVVVLPLSAAALIAIVLVARWRAPYGWPVLAGLAVGTGAAFVANESGEALAERVGTPAQHAELGSVLPLIATITLLVAIGWFALQRHAAKADQTAVGRASVRVTGIAAVIMAAMTIVICVLVGHTGATAVWDGSVPAVPSVDARAADDGYSSPS